MSYFISFGIDTCYFWRQMSPQMNVNMLNEITKRKYLNELNLSKSFNTKNDPQINGFF